MALPTTSHSKARQAALAMPGDARREDASAELKLMNPPIVYFQEAVAAVGKAAIVRGHQQGYAFSSGHVEQELKDSCAGLLIEGTGGFVSEQNFGSVHQSAAKRGALTLTPRELLNAMTEAMTETCAIGELVKTLKCNAATGSSSNGGNEAVFFESEIGNQVVKLKDEADFVA